MKPELRLPVGLAECSDATPPEHQTTEPPGTEVSRTRCRAGVLALVGAGAVVWSTVLVLVRGRPTTAWDAGVFLSVDAALTNGARLYRDITDNKEPFFYFAQAVALSAGGWRGPFLADIVWISIGAASMFGLVFATTGRRAASVAALILYPLFLTGIQYLAGNSMLPALTLLPLFAFLLARRWYMVAGISGAVILGFRVSALPIVVLVAGVMILGETSRRGRSMGRLVAGLGTGLVAGLGVLGLRGELAGFLDSLGENRRYSSAVMPIVYGTKGITGHWSVVWHNTSPGARILAALGIVVVTAALIVDRTIMRTPRLTRLASVSLAAWTGTIASLLTTAIWPHHVQLLAFALCCSTSCTIACLLEWVGPKARSSRLRSAALTTGAALAASGALVVGLSPSAKPLWLAKSWTDPPVAPVAAALRSAAETGGNAETVTYFHLGQNDEFAMVAFLPERFVLACPDFQQYPWLSRHQSERIIECLRRRRPQLVAVTPSFQARGYTHHPPGRYYRRFFATASAWLARHCSPVHTDPTTTVHACDYRVPHDPR